MARRTHTEAWWANALPTTLRCTAHYKYNGGQCRSEATAGTNVCDKHGALAPAVQAAAATRIQMSVDEASKKLIAWMSDPAVDMRERVKIAHDLLDRGGLAATSKVLLGVVTEDPIDTLFRSILSDPNGTIELATVAPAAIEPDPVQAAIDGVESYGHADVVDAEVIEELDALPATRHTQHVQESMSAAPPKHLREDLERAEQLRRLI